MMPPQRASVQDMQWQSDMQSNLHTKEHGMVMNQYRPITHPIRTRLANRPPLPQNPTQVAIKPEYNNHCIMTCLFKKL